MTTKTEQLLRKLIREEIRRFDIKEDANQLASLFNILGYGKVSRWTAVKPMNPDNLPDIKKATAGMRIPTYQFDSNTPPMADFTEPHPEDEQYFYAKVKGVGLFLVDTQGYNYCRYIIRIK